MAERVAAAEATASDLRGQVEDLRGVVNELRTARDRGVSHTESQRTDDRQVRTLDGDGTRSRRHVVEAGDEGCSGSDHQLSCQQSTVIIGWDGLVAAGFKPLLSDPRARLRTQRPGVLTGSPHYRKGTT